MKPQKILFASDLDGTLLNDDATVAPEHASQLNKMCREGLLFTISSARSPRSVEAALYGTGISPTAPAVCLNGSLLWDFKMDVPVKCFPIDRAAMDRAWAEMDKLPVSCRLFSCDRECRGPFITFYRDDLPMDPKSKAYHLKLSTEKTPVIPFTGTLPDAEIISCSYFDKGEILYPLYSALSGIVGIKVVFYKSTYRDGMSFLEFCSASGGKGAGARAAAELCGAERLFVFGDNFNDLDMFRKADMSFTPENGEEEMKKNSSRVIPSNNDGGVIKTIAEYFK